MQKRHLLTCSAACAIMTAGFAAPAFAQVEEIIITATKRAETSQNVPIAVAALGEDTLEELNVNVFTDYLVQLPGVSAGGSGPGTSTIYIRGLASTTPSLSVAGVAGLAPNVSFYLDEQPLAQPGRNLDVYAADLERVEVLSGPQGTLFGASSQAGTVRLITNKPKIGVEEAAFKAGTSFTDGGSVSYNAEAVYNVPVTDNFALRGVVYYDHQGGFIDNVQGSRSARESARFRTADTVRSNGTVVGGNRVGFQAQATDALTDAYLDDVVFLASDNSRFVEDDFNDADYFGFRIAGLYEFNDDWSLNLSYAHQELDADGVFFTDPTLGENKIQRFSDEKLDDDFDNYSWTVKGRLGQLEALYTGALTERTTDQTTDYTDYLFVGQYLPYYICDRGVTYDNEPGNGSYAAAVNPTGTCQAPDARLPSTGKTDVQTHELRFTTPAENRFRATGGVFYSDLKLEERNDFTYIGSELTTSPDGMGGTLTGFGPQVSPLAATIVQRGVFPEDVIFRNDITRTDEQFGVFGEATFDLTEQFALTVGARYYDVEVDLVGGFSNAYGNRGATTVDENANRNLDALFDGDPNPDKAVSDGVIVKVTGTYTPNDDMLFYGTFSQGFRPGLLNRPGGTAGPDGYVVPFAIDTDDVNNYEFGWKTTLADNQVRFNGSAFFVEVSDLQTTIFDPVIANLFFSDNAADAEITGLEADVTYAPYAINGLTVSGAVSLLDTEITKVIVPTGDVVKGDPLAFAPEFQGNLRARYEWETDSGLTAHVMPSIVHSAKSNSDILRFNSDVVKGYTTVGLAGGLTGDAWTAELFANNLLNDDGELSRSYGTDRERATPVRPRTIGFRMGYNFR